MVMRKQWWCDDDDNDSNADGHDDSDDNYDGDIDTNDDDTNNNNDYIYLLSFYRPLPLWYAMAKEAYKHQLVDRKVHV